MQDELRTSADRVATLERAASLAALEIHRIGTLHYHHYRHHTTVATLPTTLLQPLYRHYNTVATLRHHNSVTIPPLQYRHYNTITTIPSLHYHHYITVTVATPTTTLPSLHYRHYTVITLPLLYYPTVRCCSNPSNL